MSAEASDRPSSPPNGQVWVVTGASRGLGAAAARRAGAAGAHVIALARTKAGLEELDDAIRSAGGPPAALVPVDLRDSEAVARLGPALEARFGQVDVLAHAAGWHGGLQPVWDVTPVDMASTLAVSIAAAHGLIRTLHPLLAAAPSARAVFTTDTTPPDPPAYWSAYAAAKAGLEALVKAYAAEAEPSRIIARLVDPGPMATRLRARAFPGETAVPGVAPRAADPDIIAAWLVDKLRSAEDWGALGDTVTYPDFAPVT